MVGHVGTGPSAPADAQRVAGRDDTAQRTEVRPAVPGPARRARPCRPLQRAPEQTC